MKQIDTATLTPASFACPVEGLWLYNALDIFITFEVFEALEAQLTPETRRVYEFSKAMMAPILEMNMRGVLIDEDYRWKLVSEYRDDIARLEDNFNRLCEEGLGVPFSWSSPAQLLKLFYGVMRIPPVKKKNGNGEMRPTVDETALTKLKSYYYAKPFCDQILAAREIKKRLETLTTAVDRDHRIRTSFNIAGTNTWRLSSSFSDFGTGRNLQNIEERLRRIFVSDPGMKFANIDLEQADSRNVGAYIWKVFKDPTYLDACESGDLHTTVAMLAYPELPWQKPLGDNLAANKAIAEGTVFHRDKSIRHGCKQIGHGCLTADHEVLTPIGWQQISSMPPVIMQYAEGESKFVPVNNWTNHDFTGSLVSFVGNSIDALMTHDHRVPYKKDSRGKLKERPASAGPGRFMPLGEGYIGGNENPPARLIAAIMSDGYVTSSQSTTFHLHKQRKVLRLQKLCEQYGVEFVPLSNNKYAVRFAWKKKMDQSMFAWSKQALLDFLDEYKFWDGHEAATSVTLFSTDRVQLEWLQTLGRVLGIGGQIQKPRISGFGSVVYSLQQNSRKWASGGSVKCRSMDVQDVPVYCPTVKSGWFYVRRNGKIYVTGNTNYYGKPFGIAQVTGIDKKIIEAFQPRYFKAFPFLQPWHDWVRITLQSKGVMHNLFDYPRQFAGRLKEESTLREAIAFCGQSSTAVYMNHALVNTWRLNICQILLQVHDSLLIQYPEELEDEILPQVLAAMNVKLDIHGRVFSIPCEAKVGWNWSNWSEENPDGLRKYKGHDERKRERQPAIKLLDRRLY